MFDTFQFNRRAVPSVLCLLDYFALSVGKLQTKPNTSGQKIMLASCEAKVNGIPISLDD